MKLQYKATFLMFSFGTVILLVSLAFYDRYSHKILIRETLANNEIMAMEVAQRVEALLSEKAGLITTLASAPIIEDALLESNAELVGLSSEAREEKIETLNQKWMTAEEISSPFVQHYLSNPVASYLKKQQKLFPDDYGEIFLTNRYGAMLASTGKLTTLAHAHKYWWRAAYQEGEGRIFIDDRGFDTSVQGYVIGVVVPIKKEERVIGILKCNFNIMGSLDHLIQTFCGMKGTGRLKIVRSGGLVVIEQGREPLSSKVPEKLVEGLRKMQTEATRISDKGVAYLVAYAPVAITMGSDEFGFGGKDKSIGQVKGNVGEGWHTVIFRAQNDITEIAHQTTKLFVMLGFVFIFILAIIALFLGKRITGPILNLADAAEKLGKGQLDTKIKVTSRDEIGQLAVSFNKMTDDLKHSMASRDELTAEIEQRKKVEEANEKLIQELQQALAEIKTLSGIVPICSYCKQIRDDKGYWNQVEAYVQEHTEAQFSHGICPKCVKEHYPELDLQS